MGKDPEDVHRMRVATRRMRAARRVFRDALSEVIDLERANEELRALATVLGRARDLDVFIGALRRLSRTAPAADRPAIKAMVTDLQKQKATAQEELQRALDEGALTYLRSELHGQLQALAGAGAEKGQGRKRDSVRRTAPRLIERALRRLYRDQDNLLAPTSTELHERRILAKRARYTMEYFAPAFGDALEEPIAHMTAVQDTLGEIHDADVAVAALLQRIEAVAGDAERTADAARPGPPGDPLPGTAGRRPAHLPRAMGGPPRPQADAAPPGDVVTPGVALRARGAARGPGEGGVIASALQRESERWG